MNLTLLTYTHSKASDLHNIYFDRVKKFFNPKNQVVLCDKEINYEGIIMSIYDNESKYYKQMVNALDKVKTDYVIYSQEDYILFDAVNIDKINDLISTLENDKEISFIRLIYSGIDFNVIDYNEELIYLNSQHQYYFSTQITIWRTQDLKDMFNKSKTETIWDETKNSIHLKELNKIGLCVKAKGDKIGGHFNSSIYPYIATAIVKGKWNDSEYGNQLNTIYDEYNINKEIRGVR
jgi:hypothetical protein